MITSLSEEVGVGRRRQQVTPLDVAYHQLNDFIDKINGKIESRLQLVQQVYLEDYKEQTTLMREELRQLRANLDAEIIQQRTSDRLFQLQEERDFFRAQVFKLNEEVNQYAEENKALRKKVVDIEVETANLKAIAFNYEKKVVKLQKELNQMANFKRQSSTPSLPPPPLAHSFEKPKEAEGEKGAGEREAVGVSAGNSRINFLERRPVQTVRNRTFSKLQSATKASMKKYEEWSEKEQIISQCIREAKKEVFLRSHEKSAPSPFEEFGKVPFERFTRTDRKQLILSLLSNEKILEDFNEFLLARNSQGAASRMLRTKIGDDKFNEKLLKDLKRTFSRKMEELKTNPDLAARRDKRWE